MSLLVTTSLPGLEEKEGNIYLGNWCSRDTYILKNKEVINYHWDDREKLKRDYDYLNNFYERLLIAATNKLNEIHNVNFSVNYWRIHMGFWIYNFICSFFEKWENINKAFKDRPDIKKTKILKNNFSIYYKDTFEFNNATTSEEWNYAIYCEILKYLNKKNIIKIDFENFTKNLSIYKSFKPNILFKFKNILIKVYNFFFKFWIQRQKIFIYKTYTGKFFEYLLNFSFGQLPVLIEKYQSLSSPNLVIRKKEKLSFEEKNEFEKFININFFNHIPKCYLEDFKFIDRLINESAVPQKPKVLLSTTAIYSDDIFTKVCASQKELKNNSFIYCQHGGAYGQISYTWSEEHESKISDQYLTWGWNSEKKENIIDFGVIKNIYSFKFKKPKKLNKIIYFLRSRSKYPARVDSSTGGNTMCKYFQNCLEFFKNPLSLVFQNKIYARFHERNFQWNHEDIWKREIKNLNFSRSSDESLSAVYKNYDLIIYSYIGTGFLESLALNKPNIVIENLNNWPLRENVLNDFKKLKQAGIFFENNEEALIHLNKYKDNLHEWWHNPEVIKIKNEFISKYSRLITPYKKFNFLKNLIKEKL